MANHSSQPMANHSLGLSKNSRPLVLNYGRHSKLLSKSVLQNHRVTLYRKTTGRMRKQHRTACVCAAI